MSRVLHCYEYILLKKLEDDSNLWDSIKEENDSKPFLQLGVISGDGSCLSDLISFFKHLKDHNPSYSPSPKDPPLSHYLNCHQFVELHLDNIFKPGDKATLPRELFRCTNVRFLSLKNNFLESLPADVGRLEDLHYLALTGNRLQNASIPFSLSFLGHLEVLLLDHNLLDALPGFLLHLRSLRTVRRHGNHNYFKATFMWYHTAVNERILCIEGRTPSGIHHPPSLQFLAVKAIVGTKANFFSSPHLPTRLKDFLSDEYCKFNVCGNCRTAKIKASNGYKVYTFKNPYLGNSWVPFQHWACSLQCAEAIERPARMEQLVASIEQDHLYNCYIKEVQCSLESRYNATRQRPSLLNCSVL